MSFLSTQNILVHIPLGAGGYNLSWIEAAGTLMGLLCIWLASLEKVVNYLFGIVNVMLFAAIFFQIQLYASLMLQLFFLVANIYGWYAWSRTNSNREAELHIRWLPPAHLAAWAASCIIAIALLTHYIDPFFGALTRFTVIIFNSLGLTVAQPTLDADAWPFWDATMTVLSVAAMILMTQKYVENWLLWVTIDVISVGIFIRQGVYAMALEYLLLTGIAFNGSRIWINRARGHRQAG